MRSFKHLGWLVFFLATPLAAQDTSPAIVWESDVLDAFVKAVENQRPMVVFFASNSSFRSQEGRNISNEMREEFDHAAVQALANEAVFVTCTFDHSTNTIRDEYGRRVFQHLKLTCLPTVCVIAPRTDHLHESYRMEGSFRAATIASHLKKSFRIALEPDAPAADQSVPVPAQAAPAPATPAEAINQLSQALRAGDGSAVANLLTAPYATLYTNVFSAASRLGAAKRRLLAAMDGQFGAAEDSLPYGDDDTELREDLQKVSAVILEEAHYPELTVALVRVRINFKKGSSKTVEVRVVRENDGWKIQPAEWLGYTDEGKYRRHADLLNRLSNDYTALAQKVSAGALPSREDCREAARELYLAEVRQSQAAR